MILAQGTALIGLVNFIMSYIFVTCLNHAAECQVFKIRGLFLKAILRQDIGWYDTHQTGDFASRMTEYVDTNFRGCKGMMTNSFIFQRSQQGSGRNWRKDWHVHLLRHNIYRQFDQCLCPRMGTDLGDLISDAGITSKRSLKVPNRS